MWQNTILALEHLQRYSVCDPAKIFLTSKFSYLLFSNPTHKTKLELLQIGGRLLIATHLVQSNYLANQQQMLGFDVPFTSLSKLWKNAGPEPFCWAKPAYCDCSSSNFNLQAHILSNCGVAFTTLYPHISLPHNVCII
jgi:hypothetical protein